MLSEIKLNILKEIINSLKEKIALYLQLRFEDFRLEALERTSKISGTLVFIMMIFIFCFAGFCFICFGLAEAMSVWLNSKAYGYFATGGIMFFIAVLFILLRRPLKRFVAGNVIAIITDSSKKVESKLPLKNQQD